VKFQQGAIGVAEANFAGKSRDFGIVGRNVGGGVGRCDVVYLLILVQIPSPQYSYQY
jgi:hypothetical protein